MDLAPTPTNEQPLTPNSDEETLKAQASAFEIPSAEQPTKIGRGTLSVMERADAIEYAERGTLASEPDADRQRAYEESLEGREAVAVPPRVIERGNS